MVKFGKKVVKFRIPIIIISILLLIPAALGYINTRVNYDVLTYLPEDIETMQGQDILVKDFGTGAFSMFIVDGMEDKDVSALKAKIENIDHVSKVLWYDSLADISMPKSMLPEKVYEVFNSDTGTMMAIFFDEGTSSDGTMEAIGEVFPERNVCDCYGYKKSGRKRNSGLCTDSSSFGDIGIRYYHGIIFRSVTFYA